MKRFLTVVLALCLVVGVSTTALASGKWTDENGNNDKARLYNGTAARWGYPDAWLIMKSSKDWDPMASEPVGAWCTNHYIWYSDDCSDTTWYGFETMKAYGTGAYRVEEFMKIMSVGDDRDAWLKYQAAGAYDAQWGQYSSGVPRYVVFADTVTVYDNATGSVVATYTFVNGVRQGLGKPIF